MTAVLNILQGENFELLISTFWQAAKILFGNPTYAIWGIQSPLILLLICPSSSRVSSWSEGQENTEFNNADKPQYVTTPVDHWSHS